MSARTQPRVRQGRGGWTPLGPPATLPQGAMMVGPCPDGLDRRFFPHEAHSCRDQFGTWWCPGWPEVGT